MCLAPKSPPPAPPPLPAQAPPPLAILANPADGSAARAKLGRGGRSTLRIDKTVGAAGSLGSGLNIPT